jgi:hypothetical protein
MEAETRRVHLPYVRRSIEHGQDQSNPRQVLWLNLAAVPSFEEPFQAPMPEGPDH